MKVIVISSSPIINSNGSYFAYSPYVKELEIWAKYSDEISFFCPTWKEEKGLLISKIQFPIKKMFIAKEFNAKTFLNFIRAFQYSFLNFYKIFQSMVWAEHIHLRCPGNIGLMGCIVQIFFPSKPKTAKYAGNWDPKSKQPLSYRLQKWILSNTFLTKNMQVLVYGEWENSTNNIKPFFTASYFEKDKIDVEPRELQGKISFVFVGTLSNGKQPLYAIQLIEELQKKGHNVQLIVYGEGVEKENLCNYISNKNLENIIFLKGNQNQEIIKKAYLDNHFVVLPSLSEGWPKVIAEGMFWGCLPIATRVSCVPYMLENGNRGILLELKLQEDVENIQKIINNYSLYKDKVNNAIFWSRHYTLDVFEEEIKLLIQS
jgi:glycosyltransferase involved in cell wall biosynthesis